MATTAKTASLDPPLTFLTKAPYKTLSHISLSTTILYTVV